MINHETTQEKGVHMHCMAREQTVVCILGTTQIVPSYNYLHK